MRSLSIVAVAAVAALVYGCQDSTSPAAPSQPNPPPAASTPPDPAPAPTTTTTTTTVPAGPRTLRRATFTGANGYVTEGSARIQVEGGEHTLELESDFRTSNSAALDVRLCTNQGCTGDYVSLGALQRFGGRQSYPLADNGAGFGFVTIYCLAVRLPFGYGRLR
jgi:hypothetical protein